ncbi:MAG: hypothetical protein A2033_07730 [Bacteroidetes bacterium GWA2_31_9]|nr:MAG: hypothetical protein A2033_07730 [Bacteroidetes bacterium GWA2_31_9]
MDFLLNYKNNIVRIITHIIFWLAYWTIYAFLMSLTGKDSFFFFFYETTMFIPIDISATYFTIYFLMPKFLYARRYVAFSLYFTLSTIFTIFLVQSIHYYIYLPWLHPEHAFKYNFFQFNYYYFMISTNSVVLLAAGIKLTKYWYKDQNLKRQLENQNLISELALLRSQINPHFLFNTLNNIDSLIHLNQDMASTAIMKLSDILRYMLYEANADKVSLEKEIQYINSLIDLHSLRFSNKNFIQMVVKGNYKNVMISPMLFVPFVENAIKHGDKNCTAPGIKIEIIVNELNIHFKIENKIGNNLNKDKTGGIGLNNVRRRLELLFVNKYNLEIKHQNNNYIVNLILLTQ